MSEEVVNNQENNTQASAAAIPENAQNLGDVGASSEQPTQETEVKKPDSWYYDENMPGNADRPEWLQGKYKSVADQAKAYNEIQKKLGAHKGAPEKYDLNLPDSPVPLHENDPVIQEFLEDAKAHNVSQEYVSKLLSTYAKGIKMQKPDLQKELQELGPNAKQDLSALNNWAANHLSADELGDFRKLMTTAKSVRVLQKLKSLSHRPMTSPTASNNAGPSKESILKKIHDPRYEKDEQFRKQVRDELEQFM